MATASEDRRDVWSAQTMIELREKSLAYQLFDHSWEGDWVAGAENVSIPKPDFSANIASSRARGGNWPAAVDQSQTIVKLTRSGGYGASTELLWEDVLEINWSTVDRHRSRQGYELSHDIDTAIYDAARAATSSTITTGTAGATFVDNSAPYDYTIATGKRHPVADAIDQFVLLAYRADAVDNAGSPTGGAGRPFLIFQPELVLSFSQWLEELGLSFDPLTAQLLGNNPAEFNGGGYAGRYHGADVYSWNHLAVPTGADNWAAYGAIPQAYAVGIRPPLMQYFDPKANQVSTKPAHLIRQVGDWAGVEVADALHRKIVINSD